MNLSIRTMCSFQNTASSNLFYQICVRKPKCRKKRTAVDVRLPKDPQQGLTLNLTKLAPELKVGWK